MQAAATRAAAIIAGERRESGSGLGSGTGRAVTQWIHRIHGRTDSAGLTGLQLPSRPRIPYFYRLNVDGRSTDARKAIRLGP
jgi:hypothetical protein